MEESASGVLANEHPSAEGCTVQVSSTFSLCWAPDGVPRQRSCRIGGSLGVHRESGERSLGAPNRLSARTRATAMPKPNFPCPRRTATLPSVTGRRDCHSGRDLADCDLTAMQKHTTGKTCSIADKKRKRPGLRLESWDASRSALPRKLLTTTVCSDPHRGNGSNGPLWNCADVAPF
jgi:hypothetical protein